MRPSEPARDAPAASRDTAQRMSGREPTGPLVSVIMPFLNMERFLTESIASVVAQTYPYWELLLIDDGSSDGSAEIARSHAAADPDRIHYLTHDGGGNRGASAARNLGLSRARGEYIAFLDADDVWIDTKLAEQVPLLEAHPEAGFLYGGTLYWYSWTGRSEDRGRDYVAHPEFPDGTILEPPALLTATLEQKAPVPCTCSMIVRRSAIGRIGGFEERFRRVFTDQAFYAKLFLLAPALVSDRCWDRYRQHEDSACATAERTGQLDSARTAYLEWLQQYIQQHSIRDSRLRAAVIAALARQRSPARQRSRRVHALSERAQTAWWHRIVPFGFRLGRAILPRWVRERLWRGLGGVAALSGAPLETARRPPRPGRIRFGDLRRVEPISREFGFDRGLPVDRYYIEQFLERHSRDVRGRVLEIGDATYTRRFGGDRVQHSDVLHVDGTGSAATLVGDLASAEHIPGDAFDCVILTQTLHLIFDLQAAVRTLHRILAPGGVLLLTVPGISQLSADEWAEAWYWAMTPAALQRLFSPSFGSSLQIEARGNVLAATALLQGIAAEELRHAELDVQDAQYPLLVTLRAAKPRPHDDHGG